MAMTTLRVAPQPAALVAASFAEKLSNGQKLVTTATATTTTHRLV